MLAAGRGVTDVYKKSLLSELRSLKRDFFCIIFITSVSSILYFFVKGCQVVEIPVYKGLCNLFEVVIGCQKVDSVSRAERTEPSILLCVPKVHVFMMKLWHLVVVNILYTVEFSREFGSN